MLVTNKKLEQLIEEEEKTFNRLYKIIDNLEDRLETLRTEVEELKEKTNRVNDNEDKRKSKILEDIKAVQEYSLADALNYLKGE